MSSTRVFVRAAVALAALTPFLANAQKTGQIVVTPYVGVFAPSTDLGHTTNTHGGLLTSATIRQKAAFAFGANASYWFNRRVGLEVGSAMAMSNAEGTAMVTNPLAGFSPTGTEKARVIFGSAKAMFNLLPEDSKVTLRLGAGPALISRTGTAYQADAAGKLLGRTDAGAAVSLCSRIPLLENLGLRLRAENYVYSAKMKFVDATTVSHNFTFPSKIQNDFVLSAGLQLLINR